MLKLKKAVKVIPIALIGQTEGAQQIAQVLGQLVAPMCIALVLIALPMLILRVVIKEVLEKI